MTSNTVRLGVYYRTAATTPPMDRSCMTHCQALQDFPDMRQVLFHKVNKINLPTL